MYNINMSIGYILFLYSSFFHWLLLRLENVCLICYLLDVAWLFIFVLYVCVCRYLTRRWWFSLLVKVLGKVFLLLRWNCLLLLLSSSSAMMRRMRRRMNMILGASWLQSCGGMNTICIMARTMYTTHIQYPSNKKKSSPTTKKWSKNKQTQQTTIMSKHQQEHTKKYINTNKLFTTKHTQ